jgi:hypothetical protein
MKRADFLVNCGNITDYQLPSKIYEYMGTGKPIINFILNLRDASLQAMKDYRNLLVVIPGVTETQSVVKFIESHIENPVLEKPDGFAHVLKNHSLSSIANQYIQLLS